MHGCMRAYMHAYMHLCMHAYMHARMYVRMYVRMHECIYTQIHTHKSTHIGIQARQAVAQHQVRSPPVRVEHPVFRGLFYRLIVLLQGLRTGGGHTFSHEPAVPGRCLVARHCLRPPPSFHLPAPPPRSGSCTYAHHHVLASVRTRSHGLRAADIHSSVLARRLPSMTVVSTAAATPATANAACFPAPLQHASAPLATQHLPASQLPQSPRVRSAASASLLPMAPHALHRRRVDTAASDLNNIRV
jgi:hypothetical protein